MPPVPRPSAALAALVVVAAVLSVAVGPAAARTEGGGDASAQSVTVHAQRRSAWRLPPRPAAVGVEYLNHGACRAPDDAPGRSGSRGETTR